MQARETRSATAAGVRTYLAGALSGVLACLAGYLLIYAATIGDVRGSWFDRVAEYVSGEPSAWKIVGWIFYDAQFVDVFVPGMFGEQAVTLVGEEFSAALYVVPPLLLVFAGFVVARAFGATESLGDVARVGAATVAGYLPLIAAGTAVVAISVGDSSAGPDLVSALFLAGVVYPLLFGCLGAALARVQVRVSSR